MAAGELILIIVAVSLSQVVATLAVAFLFYRLVLQALVEVRRLSGKVMLLSSSPEARAAALNAENGDAISVGPGRRLPSIDELMQPMEEGV